MQQQDQLGNFTATTSEQPTRIMSQVRLPTTHKQQKPRDSLRIFPAPHCINVTSSPLNRLGHPVHIITLTPRIPTIPTSLTHTMTMSAFPQFPLLPWEIRNKIWTMACCEPCYLPKAHVFRIYKVSDGEEEHVHDPHKKATAPPSETSIVSGNIRLAAPRWFPANVNGECAFDIKKMGPPSWTQNNPSTYAKNSGLWTACKESLRAIERELEMNLDIDPDSGEAKLVTRASSSRPHRRLHMMTIPPHSSETEARYITISGGDLIILQVDDLATPPWASNIFGTLRTHVALEYDPKWEDNIEQAVSNYVDFMEASRLEFYYVVDYRIRRKHFVPTETQTERYGSRCYYGYGWRFPLVNPRMASNPRSLDSIQGLDLDWPWEDVFERDGRIYSAHHFIESVWSEWLRRPDLDSSSDSEDWDMAYKPHLRISVLACERYP